jgi:hypothetical protein
MLARPLPLSRAKSGVGRGPATDEAMNRKEGTTMRKGTILGGGVLVAAIAATPAPAQDRPTFELPAIEVTILQTDLHQRAMELYEVPERWAEAADLHRRAAERLLDNDAGQYFGFSRASLLYFYAGELGAARRNMERAARVAEATGDVLTAANAWVDAAFVAIAEGYAGKKREFVAEARTLAASDLIGSAGRDAILERIEGAPAGPESARVALAHRFGSIGSMAAVAAD